MERINLSEIMRKNRTWTDGSKESWLQWILLEAVSKKPMKHFRAKDSEDAILEVELVINGQNIKMSDFINGLHDHFERNVNKVAKSLIDDRIEKELEKFEEAVEECRNKLHDASSEIKTGD